MYRHLAFTPAFWSFAFPYAAVATFALHWINYGKPPGYRIWAWVVLLAITALVDPLVERYGFDARSPYAETYWLGVVGPSAMWALRRLTAWLAAEPDGFELPLGPLGRLAHRLGASGRVRALFEYRDRRLRELLGST